MVAQGSRPYPWRMHYTADRHQPRYRALCRTPEYALAYHHLIDYASEQPGADRWTIDTSDREALAIEVTDGDVELLNAALEEILRLKMAEMDADGRLSFPDVARRQGKPSDRPERTAERQRKSRERRKTEGVTPTSRDGHAPEKEVEEERDVEGEKTHTTVGSADGARVTRTDAGSGDGNDGAGTVLPFPGSIPSTPHSAAPPFSPDEAFAALWKAYPRKVARAEAEKAYRATVPDADTATAVRAGLARWVASWEWRESDGRYIPHPARWLTERRWEAEPRPGTGKQRMGVIDTALALAEKYRAEDESGITPGDGLFSGLFRDADIADDTIDVEADFA